MTKKEVDYNIGISEWNDPIYSTEYRILFSMSKYAAFCILFFIFLVFEKAIGKRKGKQAKALPEVSGFRYFANPYHLVGVIILSLLIYFILKFLFSH